MAHRADRVTDLVRDARAQAAEGRQFRLLHPLVHDADVFQEHKHRSGARRVCAERREVRDDPQVVALGDQREFRVRGHHRVVAPASQVVKQFQRRPLERLAGD